MSLYSVEDLKGYLRIEHSADDILLAALAASAAAMLDAYLGRPVVSAEQTFTDDAQPVAGGHVGALLVPTYPLGTLTSVTHEDGEAFDVATLTVGRGGTIRRADGLHFRRGPYTIVATVGLDLLPDYATAVEPVMQQAVRDIVADLYLRRNPAATAENEGGGVSQSYGAVDAQGIPLRTAAMIRPWRLVEVSR